MGGVCVVALALALGLLGLGAFLWSLEDSEIETGSAVTCRVSGGSLTRLDRESGCPAGQRAREGRSLVGVRGAKLLP